MSRRLLGTEIRGRAPAAGLVSALAARARSARGQTTVEWLVLMVGLAVLITVLAGSDVWHQAGKVVVDAAHAIFNGGDRV